MLKAGTDDRSRLKQPDDPQKMLALKRNAAGRRPIAWSRHVHEYRAAMTLHPRPFVVIQHNNDVVEMVLPPHPFSARGIGVLDLAVVVAITDGVAPAVIGPEGRNGDAREGTTQPVRPIENSANLERANRGRAVAFPLQGTAS